MKRILFFFVLNAVPYWANTQCGWRPAISPINTDLLAVHFPNQQNGWAVGVGGKVVHSSNGGQTWVKQDAQTTFVLSSVHFIDASTGWIVGNEGVVRVTTDGGKSWWPKDVCPPVDLYDVWFADANNGWISGACGLILRTTDGGANWTIINTNQTSNIYQVKVPNGTNGAAATSSTVLLNTSNGGTVWPPVTVTPRSFRALDIAANGMAFAAAANGPVIHSLDAGITWTPATRPPGRGAWQSLSIANSNAVYVAGLGGQVYKSSDRGNTWTDFSSGLGYTNIYGLQMASDSVGWAVGEGGKIFFLRIPPRPLSISGNFDFCDSTRLTAVGSHTQWAWSNGRNNSFISVTASGTYTVTATSAEGCTSAASIAVPRPSLASLVIDNVGRPTCAGQATGRATAIASGGVGTVTFLWSNNTVGGTINNVPIGTYTVTATNGNGCTSTASVEIKSNNPPANVVITPTAAACGQSNGRIDLTGPLTASYTYRWNTNATSKNLSNIPGGTYTVTVTDLSIGCTSVFTTVVGGTIPTISGIATTPANCAQSDGVANLSAANTINPTYLWSNAATTEDLQGVPSGTYTVTVTNPNSACTATATATAIIANTGQAVPPTVSAPQGNTLNCQRPTLSFIASGGNQYTWAGPSGFTANTAQINVTTKGTYIVTSTITGVCSATATVVVLEDKNKPTLSATNGMLTCTQPSVQLNVTSSDTSFQWIGPNGFSSILQNPIVTVAGIYTVTVTAPNGCINSATAIVDGSNQLPTSIATATGPTTFCTGESVNLNASVGPNYAYQWLLNGVAISGATNATYNAITAGAYAIQVTQNGCRAISKPVTVLVNPLPNVALNSTGSCLSDTVLLNTMVTACYSYQWKRNGVDIANETSAFYTATIEGSYSVEVSHNGCKASSQTLAIGVFPTASVIPSGSTTICAGSSVTLNATTDTNYTYQWQRNGANIPGAANPTFTANVAGNYSVVVTDNGCSATSTAVIVNVLALPVATITAGGPTTFCTGGSVVLNATAGANYTYQWRRDGVAIPTATGVTYTATTSGNYSVEVLQNGCKSASNNVVVLTNALPVATITAGGSTTFCMGGSVVLNATTGANYTYQWQRDGVTIPTATGVTYTATISGNYSVEVLQNGCKSVSNNVAVLVNAVPTAAITSGGPTTFCAGGSVVLTATTGSNYTHQWQRDGVTIPTATGVTYTATTSGNYSVEVLQNGCKSVSNNVVVLVNAVPTAAITAGGPMTFCAGGSVVLNATTGMGYTYQWQRDGATVANAIGATYTASTGGNYSVEVSQNGCKSVSNIVAVLVNAAPTAAITAGGPTTFCTGGSVVLNATTGTGYTYQWQRDGATIANATGPTYTATTGGNYSVEVSQNGCKTVSNIVAVLVNAAPTAVIDAGGPTTFCAGGSVVLNATTGTGYTYQWQRDGATIANATGATYMATTSGNYSVEVSQDGCKTVSNNITVLVNATPNAAIASVGPTTFCMGGSIVLTATTGTGYTYQWQRDGAIIPTAAGPTYTATTSGNYSVEVLQNGCKSVSNNVAVLVNAVPTATITAGGPTTFCTGGSIVLTATTGTGYTHQWQRDGVTIPTATGATYTATTSGNYSVEVSQNGCKLVSNNIEVLVNTVPVATITAVGSTTFCAGGSVVLNATTSTNYTYQWQRDGIAIPNATGATYTATNSDNYSVEVSQNGCKTISQSIAVTVNALPNAAITTTSPASICTGSSITLRAEPGAGYSYQWKRNGANLVGETSATYIATVGGNYSVEVTLNDCIKESQILTVTESVLPPVVVGVADSTAFCEGDSARLMAPIGQGYLYQWYHDGNIIPEATDLLYVAKQTGNYRLKVTYGTCEAFSQVVNIVTSAAPNFTVSIVPASCDLNNGRLLLTGVTGSTPFKYAWSNGATMRDLVNLSQGVYTVTVRDAKGCTTVKNALVENSGKPNIAPEVVNADCGKENGSIKTTISGGVPPYKYTWNTGATTGQLNNLRPGTYTLTVADQISCLQTVVLQVSNPLPTVALLATPAQCGSEGQLLTQVSGGRMPYSYVWNTGNTDKDLRNIPAGVYIVTVRDADNCIGIKSINLPGLKQPNAVARGGVLTCDSTYISLIGFSDTLGVSCAWRFPNGAVLQGCTLKTSVLGQYTFIATAANGCTGTATAEVKENRTPPKVEAKGGGVTCQSPSIRLQGIVDGTDISFQWKGPDNFTSYEQNPLVNIVGLYSLFVKGPNGCWGEDTAKVYGTGALPPPKIDGPGVICSGKQVALDAGSGYTQYR